MLSVNSERGAKLATKKASGGFAKDEVILKRVAESSSRTVHQHFEVSRQHFVNVRLGVKRCARVLANTLLADNDHLASTKRLLPLFAHFVLIKTSMSGYKQAPARADDPRQLRHPMLLQGSSQMREDR